VSEVDVDISESALILKAKDKYYLDIKLPFKVNSEEGNAKFDSKTRTLKLTLPTIKEERPIFELKREEPPVDNGEENEEEDPSMLKFVNKEQINKANQGNKIF
jgi:dynein assembly factor 2